MIRDFLEEQTDKKTELLKFLNSHCTKILKELSGDLLFRAVHKRVPEYEVFHSHLENRKPTDTDPKDHNFFNELFIKEFGWPCRNGVFVNAHGSTESSLYGKKYIFYPIGDYKYVWSPKTSDLFSFSMNIEHMEQEKKEGEMRRIVKTYLDTEIHKAVRIHIVNEISFKCETYVLVNMRYENTLRGWLGWK